MREDEIEFIEKIIDWGINGKNKDYISKVNLEKVKIILERNYPEKVLEIFGEEDICCSSIKRKLIRNKFILFYNEIKNNNMND